MLALHTPHGQINIVYSLQYFLFAICLAALCIHAIIMMAHCWHTAGTLLAHCWHTWEFILSMVHVLALGQQVTGEIVL